METYNAEMIEPQFTAMAVSYLLVWLSIDWMIHLGNKFSDWIESHLEAATEALNRPSHVPGLTLFDVMRRRYMQQRIHGRKT